VGIEKLGYLPPDPYDPPWPEKAEIRKSGPICIIGIQGFHIVLQVVGKIAEQPIGRFFVQGFQGVKCPLMALGNDTYGFNGK